MTTTVTLSAVGDNLDATSTATIPTEKEAAFRAGLDLFMGKIPDQPPPKVTWAEAANFLAEFVIEQGQAYLDSKGSTT